MRMAKKFVQLSALEGRIRQGKADPITSAEKRLVADLREGYEKKYGSYKSAKTGRFAPAPQSGRTPKVQTRKSASKTTK